MRRGGDKTEKGSHWLPTLAKITAVSGLLIMGAGSVISSVRIGSATFTARQTSMR